MRRKKQNIVLENIKVEDYAAEGKSLARVDGKVIFIENAVPGDVVDVQISKNKKDWAEGKAFKFHSYSTDRVEPFCSHFGVCGGCHWQMLPYAKQLEYKQRQVRDNLQRIGKLALPEILPIIGAEKTTFYRNKLEYTFGTKEYTRQKPVRNQEKDQLLTRQHPVATDVNPKEVWESLSDLFPVPVIPEAFGPEFKGAGFHAKGFFDKIVDIKKCWLQEEPTNAIRLAIKDFAVANDYSFYDIRNHYGFLRTLQLRVCTTGEVMVNVVMGEDNKLQRDKLLGYVMNQFPNLTTLLYTINTKMNDSLHDLEPVPYYGKGYIIEKMFAEPRHDAEMPSGEFQFKIGPKSFFQTNTWQGEKLYKITRDFAELTGSEIVYDLYCGTGSIGIFVSKNAKKVIGVEMVAAAIRDANENAALNFVSNAEFYEGDVAVVCNDEFFSRHGRPGVIITDPPRAGMHEKLVRKILDIAAPLIVYVSCNPATQARDLNLLDEKYSVTKIQPVDMFPHTLHIENVVQLKLKNN